MSEKRVSKNNPNGLPAPPDVVFVEVYQASNNLDDLYRRLADKGFYLSYATVLARRKRINEALANAGRGSLKEMPRKSGAASVDIDSIGDLMDRLNGETEEVVAESE